MVLCYSFTLQPSQRGLRRPICHASSIRPLFRFYPTVRSRLVSPPVFPSSSRPTPPPSTVILDRRRWPGELLPRPPASISRRSSGHLFTSSTPRSSRPREPPNAAGGGGGAGQPARRAPPAGGLLLRVRLNPPPRALRRGLHDRLHPRHPRPAPVALRELGEESRALLRMDGSPRPRRCTHYSGWMARLGPDAHRRWGVLQSIC
uniref:Uncharacterized protein n=1 Tax=Oryza nivara TaxID=4536 RepID=A0A0E0HSE8_ORYNI